MPNPDDLIDSLDAVLTTYKASFETKVYAEENDDIDLLMDVFGITPDLKRENRQYWGRELGKCWEGLVVQVFKGFREDYRPGLRIDGDEPCDLIAGNYAIDTKYRIGSGDSGTLKKFRTYGRLLTEQSYTPQLLFVRSDNLPAALTACRSGGWNVFTGNDSFEFIYQETEFDLKSFLQERARRYGLSRSLREL